MSDESGPQEPEPNPYDIGRFLSHGLNRTPEEVAEWLLVVRKGLARADVEYDLDQIVPVEADWLLDLVTMAEHLLEMWEDDEHFVNFDYDGWTVEHSLRCRATGNMQRCGYHTGVVDFLEWTPPFDPLEDSESLSAILRS